MRCPAETLGDGKGREDSRRRPAERYRGGIMSITKTLLAGFVGVATAISGHSLAQSQQPPVKNIVLVHGAFADGTSWAKVIPILEARGFHVVAVLNPLTSLSAD